MAATVCSTRRSIFGRGSASSRVTGSLAGGGWSKLTCSSASVASRAQQPTAAHLAA